MRKSRILCHSTGLHTGNKIYNSYITVAVYLFTRNPIGWNQYNVHKRIILYVTECELSVFPCIHSSIR